MAIGDGANDVNMIKSKDQIESSNKKKDKIFFYVLDRYCSGQIC